MKQNGENAAKPTTGLVRTNCINFYVDNGYLYDGYLYDGYLIMDIYMISICL